MGTFSSATSLLPGRNPAGTSVAGDYSIVPTTPQTGTTSGQNPFTPPPNIPSGAPQSNPYAPGSIVPTFGANAGPYSPTSLTGGTASPTSFQSAQTGAMGGFFSGMTQQGLNDMFHELNKTYGEGTASAIMNFLMSGAGFNQGAVNNLFAALQPGIERGTESLMEQFSTSGNRFGSGAQIGLADYLSQVQLNEGQLETQMYEQGVNNYINTLLDVAGGNKSRISSTPSTFDQILSGLQLGGTAANAVNQLGATGTGTLSSILDTIGGFGL